MSLQCDQNGNDGGVRPLLQLRLASWLAVFCKTFCPLITIHYPTYTSVALRGGGFASRMVRGELS
jgi:hypothetical protein